MPNNDGNHLKSNLQIPSGAAGIFGLCYSVLTWSGVFKGFELSKPKSWAKTAGKMIEDGHATTFLLELANQQEKEDVINKEEEQKHGKELEYEEKDLKQDKEETKYVAPRQKSKKKKIKHNKKKTKYKDRKKDRLTLTGIGDIDDEGNEGWLFESGDLGEMEWSRNTGSSTTYVYYIGVDEDFLERYEVVKNELEGTQTKYAALWPNLPFARTTYQNCVSHSHCLMSKLGLGHFNPQRRGWWIPSASNWMEWLKSFVAIPKGGFSWKYKKFENTNTHIP